jgi:hypothetical protein
VEPRKLQQIVEVAGPSDRHRDTGDAVFQNQIPAGQPGQQFPERGIRKGIGAPGYRNHRRHFGIAECRQRTGQSRENEGQDDPWTGARSMGIANNGCSDQHENPCPNNGTDPKAGQIPGRQRLFEPVSGVVRIGQDLFDRFGPEEMGDHRASINGDGRRLGRSGTVEDIFMFHVPSSIAGGRGHSANV